MIRLHVWRFNRDVIKNNSLTDKSYIFLNKRTTIFSKRKSFTKRIYYFYLTKHYTTKLNKLNDDNLTLPLFYIEVSQSPTYM